MTTQQTTQATALREVLDETWPVLLDFDGPVTHLFIQGRSKMVADRMREALPAGLDVPTELRDTADPLVILRWTAEHLDPERAAEVDSASTAGELVAVEASSPTPGAVELLQACSAVGRPVVIVSNNAEPAIEAFLGRYDLRHLVQAIVARVPRHPELMKPHPDSIRRAIGLLDRPAERCVLVGDSVTDIEVCRATGVRSIGYAKNPQRGRELHAAGADALTQTILELASVIRTAEPGSI